MPVFGIGTDIVDVSRIVRALQKHPERFAEKILAAEEFLEFSASTQKARFLAKRFAAKEAASKALGTGMRHGVWFTDFCVSHSESGQPLLQCRGRAGKLQADYQIQSSHLSLSDESDYVVAFVVMET